MRKIIVVGGGAAGMFAALAAAEAGAKVVLLEQNEKLGKKLFITGKGRCNLTNACDTEEIFKSITRNSRFLYSAIYSYDNFRVMDFFETHGMPVKTERGGRVFPCSDHSSDVIATLKKALMAAGVEIRLHTRVSRLLIGEGRAGGVLLADGKEEHADAVILATGGCSYESTGSTGDGYRYAGDAGHHIIKPQPSLVPFEVREDYVKELQGLSLKNVNVTIKNGKKKLYSDFGEMLFTHFGVSGPLLISASSKLGADDVTKPLSAEIDLKPALSDEQLDKRILRDFAENQNKQLINAVAGLFPSKLTPVVIRLSGIAPDKKVNAVTAQERQALVHCTKHFPFTLDGVRGFSEAIITRGGVETKEINPSTMESKLVDNLYFAGELIDVDALTGGYNLQIAWSTGYLAGSSAAEC